jgi:hypothetical protein
MKTQKTLDPTLRSMQAIRRAWFDEILDAGLRGDAAAAALASVNVTAVDAKIRWLEKQRNAKGAPR